MHMQRRAYMHGDLGWGWLVALCVCPWHVMRAVGYGHQYVRAKIYICIYGNVGSGMEGYMGRNRGFVAPGDGSA
ncbi:uncharacterized protein B0H64DRAFT_390670 [Chaetomium fimeti]|uniref:Secreted protein n=1 Tax=Chaetomium fimeti TaxID=1854472 RepID=A0AAE0HI53_9PEZI|nr:hypothetical protein B0H64DRAFT_390670 [Chaetomium fimeti]